MLVVKAIVMLLSRKIIYQKSCRRRGGSFKMLLSGKFFPHWELAFVGKVLKVLPLAPPPPKKTWNPRRHCRPLIYKYLHPFGNAFLKKHVNSLPSVMPLYIHNSKTLVVRFSMFSKLYRPIKLGISPSVAIGPFRPS